MGICVGMTVALALGAIAFIATRPAQREVAAAASSPSAGPTSPAAGAQGAGAPAAVVDVTTRKLGDLQVQVEARISAPGSYDPITMAQVVVVTDMIAMPMSHRQGPTVMAEAAGRKGTYQAVATLPMPGEYDVAVEVKQPMAATAHERVTV